MKQQNSIHLDGAVDSCRLVRDRKGRSMAAVVLRTFHPRLHVPQTAKASERYEMLYHRVAVVVDESNRSMLEGIASELKAGERGSVLVPCSVDGSLVFSDGDAIVQCPADGISRHEKLNVSDNNKVTLTGRITELSVPGQSASLLVHTRSGDVRVFVLKDVNPQGWNDIAEGRVFKKNDMVYLSGPLLSRMHTDGEKDIRICSVSARTLSQLKLSKDVRKKSGPSVG